MLYKMLDINTNNNEEKVLFRVKYWDSLYGDREGSVIEERGKSYVVIPDEAIMLTQIWPKFKCDKIK